MNSEKMVLHVHQSAEETFLDCFLPTISGIHGKKKGAVFVYFSDWRGIFKWMIFVSRVFLEDGL